MEKTPADNFFELLDTRLNDGAASIVNRVFAEYKDIKLTNEQYKALRPIIRKELNSLVWNVLAFFDNVGGVLPNDIDGFKLMDSKYDTDIRHGDADYAAMWQEFLISRK